MEIEEHYNASVGYPVTLPWQISGVDLKFQEQRVDIDIEYADDEDPCPECGAVSPKLLGLN